MKGKRKRTEEDGNGRNGSEKREYKRKKPRKEWEK